MAFNRHLVIAAAACLPVFAPQAALAQFGGFTSILNKLQSTPVPNLDASTVKMSGQQMLDELRQLRRGFSIGKPPLLFDPRELPSATAPSSGGIGSLFSSISSTISSAMSNPLAAAGTVAASGADALIDAVAAEVSYAAIDQLLGKVLDEPATLSKIEISIPDPARLSPDIKKKVMTMGSYLTALKASNLAIDSAQKSLELAKSSYKEVVEMRAQQVKLLGEGVFARQGLVKSLQEEKARGASLISDEDRAYLAKFEGKPVESLVGDPIAVNIVFSYLRGLDPERFKDYTVKVAEMRSHYDAYVRATLGSASMIGFTGMFVKQARKYADQYKLAGATELAPLLTQALSEVATTIPRVSRVSQSSDGIVEGSFQVELNGKVLQSGATAQKALAALDDAGAKRFREMLLPQGSGTRGGMLFRLYGQATDSAADILDEMTAKDSRNQFGKAALQSEADNFLFKNALLGMQAAERKKLGQELLYENEHSGDPAEEATAKLQSEITANALKLGNGHLRMLMFASAPQAASGSALRIGDFVVRIENPGVDGIADYEKLSQQSLSQATVRDFARDKADSRPQ